MNNSKLKHFNPMALREKYSAENIKKRTNPFSSFWADNDWDSRRSDFILEDEQPVKKGVDHVALASYRRAISNFVTIVTNDGSIPVKFQSSDDSYTDGKTVVIGSKIDEKNFDPVVGLALHEGSHIKLSDFDVVRNLENNIPQELFVRAESLGFQKWDVVQQVKNLLNYVEDRRIDYYVFSTSPGYKGYYHSMYDKYFHAKVIDKALKSSEYTSLDWDSYIFRIINLTNKNSNLDALPSLRDIYQIIFKSGGGVKNLNNTQDALEVALGVLRLIYSNLEPMVSDSEDNSESNDESGDGAGSDEPKKLSDEEFQDMMDNMESGGSSDKESKGVEVELTDAQKRQLGNAVRKQKEFLNGETKKQGKLSKKDTKIVKTMEEAGVTQETAGEGLETKYDYRTNSYKKSGTKVIVIKKLTKDMIEEEMFPSVLTNSHWRSEEYDANISRGIQLGSKLGKKLQVRGESRETKWTRLDSGRIDKRLVAELGFGNERVFSTSFVDSYQDAFIHISVDASGSMGGDKWNKSMTSVVAICKAASMIQNLDVVVSFRSTHNSNRYHRGADLTLPLVLIAYDSRVDKFSKVKNMFANIHPGGTTPEGLCFEAIMDEIVPTATNIDSFFLNFSDGMPMFSNNEIDYYYETAVNHTRKMVDNIRSRGIQDLSYFIGGDYGDERNLSDFRKMYGKDAEMIDVTSVISVSKTMNKKFLEK